MKWQMQGNQMAETTTVETNASQRPLGKHEITSIVSIVSFNGMEMRLFIDVFISRALAIPSLRKQLLGVSSDRPAEALETIT